MKNRRRKVAMIGALSCLLAVCGMFVLSRSDARPAVTTSAKPPNQNSTNWVFAVRMTNAFIFVDDQVKLLIGDRKGKTVTNVCSVHNKRGLGLGEGMEFGIAVPADARVFQLVIPVKTISKSRVDFAVSVQDHAPKFVDLAIKSLFKKLGLNWKSHIVKSGTWVFEQDSWRETSSAVTE